MFINKTKPDGFFTNVDDYKKMSGDDNGEYIIEISEQEHIELINEISKGRKMVLKNKKITTEPAVDETPSSIIKESLITSADYNIRPLSDYIMAGVATEEDKKLHKQWLIYRKAVENIDETSGTILWPTRPDEVTQ